MDATRERDEARRVVVTDVRAEQEQDCVLEEDGHAERGDQRCYARRLAQRLEGDALDRDGEDARSERRRSEHEHQRERHRYRKGGGPSEPAQHAEADESTDHVHLALREIEQSQDAIHDRVAEREERVEASERQAVDQLLGEEVHGAVRGLPGGACPGRPRVQSSCAPTRARSRTCRP